MNPMQSPNTGVGRGLCIREETHKMTEREFRQRFAHYFLDLKEENARDGGKVNMRREWEFFLTHSIEEGTISPEAFAWKCPRSLKGL